MAMRASGRRGRYYSRCPVHGGNTSSIFDTIASGKTYMMCHDMVAHTQHRQISDAITIAAIRRKSLRRLQCSSTCEA